MRHGPLSPGPCGPSHPSAHSCSSRLRTSQRSLPHTQTQPVSFHNTSDNPSGLTGKGLTKTEQNQSNSKLTHKHKIHYSVPSFGKLWPLNIILKFERLKTTRAKCLKKKKKILYIRLLKVLHFQNLDYLKFIILLYEYEPQ